MIARCLLLLLASASLARADARFDSTAALAKARELRTAVSAGDPARLWPEFDAGMRAAMKDSVSFAVTLAGIAASTGPIDSVLSEEVYSRAGHFVYSARCKYAKSPAPLQLVMTFDAGGRVAGLFVRPEPTEKPKARASKFLDYRTKTRLCLPFREDWDVYWGGRTIEQNYHAASRDQRFAHDVLIIRDGRSHHSSGRKLTDYFCYGQPILAPAAGRVVWARDSLPDNAPGVMDASNPTGNAIVIDHGNGEFSLFAHLQPGAQPFAVGDSVSDGAVIGLCGNSGNTSEPHLHYHLQNSPTPLDGDGLPVQFVDLVVDGKPTERAEIAKGQKVRRAK